MEVRLGDGISGLLSLEEGSVGMVLSDLVADPYAGSGSTGRAAEMCGRRFVGWDICERFGHRTCP